MCTDDMLRRLAPLARKDTRTIGHSEKFNPPAIPHFVYHSGQAGDIILGNFDASYAVLPNAYIGFNGFALDQLSPNRTNGQNVSHSIESEIYVGPGVRYVFNPENALNINLYQNVFSRNATTGTVVNFQFVYRF
jgi:hypothetical protein